MDFLRPQGVEVAYEHTGTAPPLVFAHGAADDSRAWQLQLSGLSDEFTVVALDEPGALRERAGPWRRRAPVAPIV
jgi:pimeloyl-ACP methyl ester carboxylesterase